MNRLEEILFDSNEKIVSVLEVNTIRKFLSTGVWGNGFEHIKPISLLVTYIACVAVGVLLALITIL